jgi:hypothetical protein
MADTSLTDDLCHAVTTAAGICRMAGYFPPSKKPACWETLRSLLLDLARLLEIEGRDSLAQFRARYPSPPEPWCGVAAPSNHEIGFHYAAGVLHGVSGVCLLAAKGQAFPTSETVVPYAAVLRARWASVQNFLRMNARKRKEIRRLVSLIRDEAARPPAAEAGQRETTRAQLPKKLKRRKAKPDEEAKRAERQERERRDRRLAEAWAGGMGQYTSIADLAAAKGIPKREAQLALDRHRKRLERSGRRK